jgi:16S rRNA (guanine966-N2)-methyltransferase
MRITGGRLNHRIVPAPHGMTTRPTTEAVREALFSSLVHRCDLDDLRILDCYCGSGILSFESLSRGARSAIMVDSNADVCRLVRSTATNLGLGEVVTIMKADALHAIGTLPRRTIDLVFADPPYALRACNAIAHVLATHDVVRDGGLVVLEHEDAEVLLPSPAWEPCTTLTVGSTVIDIIRRVDTSS